LGGTVCLEQLAELLDSEACVTDDTAQSEGIDRVVARDGDDSQPVGHDDVLALARHREPGLLEGADCIEVVYAGDLRQD